MYRLVVELQAGGRAAACKIYWCLVAQESSDGFNIVALYTGWGVALPPLVWPPFPLLVPMSADYVSTRPFWSSRHLRWSHTCGRPDPGFRRSSGWWGNNNGSSCLELPNLNPQRPSWQSRDPWLQRIELDLFLLHNSPTHAHAHTHMPEDGDSYTCHRLLGCHRP